MVEEEEERERLMKVEAAQVISPFSIVSAFCSARARLQVDLITFVT